MVRGVLEELYGDTADVLMGYTTVEECVDYKPYNCDLAVRSIIHAMVFGKRIAIHADIDMDGFGCAYILNKFFKAVCPDKQLVTFTNKAKYHGITEGFVKYFNELGDNDLLIIVDSATNDVELIKNIECDTVVIDHHEVSEDTKQKGLQGDTKGGSYVIATNMLGTDEDSKISGCGVVYYVIREVCRKLNIDLDELNLSLEQWVGLTLISDVIQLANKRCQYFIKRLYEDNCIEQGIRAMMGSLNVNRVDKNLIAYKIVPLINSAIRCGSSVKALNVVLNESKSISELEQFKKYQRDLVKYALAYGETNVSENLVSMNINNLGIPVEIRKNYCGVIAAQLSSIFGKPSYVYIEEDGVYRGSVRGVNSDDDYRASCEEAGFSARGHKAAFGLDIDKNSYSKLESLMCGFNKKSERFISVGQVKGGILHIDSLQQLRQGGNMMLLAIANSRLSSNETIDIHAKLDNLTYTTRGKGKIYTLDGIELVSFDELRGTDVSIYAEFSNFGISLYVSDNNK